MDAAFWAALAGILMLVAYLVGAVIAYARRDFEMPRCARCHMFKHLDYVWRHKRYCYSCYLNVRDW